MASIEGADVHVDGPETKRQKADILNENEEAPSEFSFSSKPTLEDIRQLQAEFARVRNWDKFHQPRNLLLALVGEVGELAEVFQWRGEVKEGLTDWSSKEKEDLEHELSDVLIYLVRLSEKCNIDLPSAVLRKFKLNGQKYPAKEVYGSSRKYTEYGKDDA